MCGLVGILLLVSIMKYDTHSTANGSLGSAFIDLSVSSIFLKSDYLIVLSL